MFPPILEHMEMLQSIHGLLLCAIVYFHLLKLAKPALELRKINGFYKFLTEYSYEKQFVVHTADCVH